MSAISVRGLRKSFGDTGPPRHLRGHHRDVPVVQAVTVQRRALRPLVRDVEGAVPADLRVGPLRERGQPAAERVDTT